MNRKYLDDIGATDRPDTWNSIDKRQVKWEKERDIYGFDERETWNLDYSFQLWLYERLKMYKKVSNVALYDELNSVEYNGKSYPMGVLIDMMLERLEAVLTGKIDPDSSTENFNYVHEIEKIWAVIMPAMWW